MKIERLVTLCAMTTLMLVLLAGCENNEPGKPVTLTNPTCEDLGKITDNAAHAALLAKCPGYLPGGRKKSQAKEW